MEGLLCLVVVAGLIGFVVWQYIETRNAVTRTTVSTACEPAAAARIVNDAFIGPRSVLWTPVGGPGTINMRRRGARGGITMAIVIERRAGGGSEVTMWASETTVYLGLLVNFAGVVNRRRAAIGHALTGAGRLGSV